ncbi:MAG: dephospho-CoA kinase, partial [Nannocystaceae bacterium]
EAGFRTVRRKDLTDRRGYLAGDDRRRVRELMDLVDDDGVDAILYEVPILFEQNLAPMFTATVVVCAPEEARLRRVIARDGVSAEEVRDRMRHQLSDAEKRAKATHVVENDAGLDALGARVAVLARELFGIESTAVPGDAESDSRP